MKRRWIFAALLVLILSYGFLSLTDLVSPCFFRRVTGVPCPGCGMSRAFRALLDGRPADAFYWHPLFIMPVVFLFLFYLQFVRNMRIPAGVWLGLALLLTGVYVIRMILLFPDQAPMNFNEDALILRLIRRPALLR